jgi:hypothetical protein
MQGRLISSLFVAILFLLICSCGERPSPDLPLKARIVTSTAAGYQYRDVTIETLSNLDQVDGTYARVLSNASIDANAEISEVTTSGINSIFIDRGTPPSLEYSLDGDVIVARNFVTLEILSLYYSFEQTVKFWVNNMNLDIDDFGKSTLYHAPVARSETSSASAGLIIKINAAYLPSDNIFLLFQTSALEMIPMNINFGVLAHEFGHAIFDYKFAERDITAYSTDLTESDDILSAINEGLSDFFSYMVSNRLQELNASLEIFEKERQLPVSWTYSTLKTSGCTGDYYCEGSILASALYEISEFANHTPTSVGTAVYNSLDKFRLDWDESKESLGFDFHFLINRILTELPDSDKSAYCTVFSKWFDVQGVLDALTCS